MPILHHQNYTIDYEITQRRINQKNIILRVRQGHVVVSAPKYATPAQIESTLKKHMDWIIKKLQQEQLSREASGEPLILRTIYWRGQACKIVPVRKNPNHFHGTVSTPDDAVVSISDQKIYVHTPFDTDSDSPEMNVYLHKVISQKLFSCASVLIPDLVMKLGESFQLLPKRVIVKEQRSRYGSCSTNGSIYMNWRLIQAPASVLRYVAIHELAHLREHNHSVHFWRLVESMMPDYRYERKWLKDNGNSLFLLNFPAKGH